MFRAACHLARHGVTGEAALELLDCVPADPPFTEEELRHKVESAFKSVNGENEFGAIGSQSEFDIVADFVPSTETIAAEEGDEMIVENGETTKIRKKKWLWKDHIRENYVTIIFGRPGQMKGLIVTSLIATATRGNAWPDGDICGEQINVLMMSLEEDFDDELLPRLKAADADLRRVHFATKVSRKRGKKKSPFFNTDDDLPALGRTVRKLGIKLLVIDPLSSFTGRRKSKDQEDMRQTLEGLKLFAKEHKVSIIVVLHCKKTIETTSALDLISGSGAIGAVVRNAFYVSKKPDDETVSRFLPAKNNSNAQSPGFVVQCHPTVVDVEDEDGNQSTDDTARVEWIGKAHLHADDIIHELRIDSKSGSKLNDALDFYRDHLADGPVSAMDLKQAAKQERISERTLQRARDHLGVIFQKSGGMYSLPDQPQLDFASIERNF